MLVINRETDYAARIVLFLARMPPGTRATAQEVARQCHVPRAIVRRVVTRLGTAGILNTTRGGGGGISLACPPEQISLLDVVEGMEGPPILNTCVRDPEICPLIEQCTVHLAWVQASDMVMDYLRSTTFASLARGVPTPSP